MSGLYWGFTLLVILSVPIPLPAEERITKRSDPQLGNRLLTSWVKRQFCVQLRAVQTKKGNHLWHEKI